jgi:hypothetical protein
MVVLLGPPLESPLAAGPEAVFLVVPGPVTTLMPLAGPLVRRHARSSSSASSVLASSSSAPPRPGRGEFKSPAERARLLALPPLDVQAAAAVDWDALVRELDRGV